MITSVLLSKKTSGNDSSSPYDGRILVNYRKIAGGRQIDSDASYRRAIVVLMKGTGLDRRAQDGPVLREETASKPY
jgi:hypothetical protein